MQKERLQKLNGWARQNLTQYILPFWTSDFIIDHEYGGFYGRVSASMEIDNTEPRGLTLAGRMTYAFSVAYRVLDDEVCKERATYAYRDLISRFYDSEYGGAYPTVSAQGDVISDDKPTYCEAFLLMGCAAYYYATGDADALEVAYQTFRLMETKVKLRPGCYHNNMTRDWKPAPGMGFGSKKTSPAFSMPEGAVMFPHHLCQAYVGRYPLATGQVYAARRHVGQGECYPPYYLYPAGTDVWDVRYQMPVEECGNMLIMLEAGRAFGADPALAKQYRSLLDTWVQYLVKYGEDPDEQLCTDDFAGHLAHNVNLAAKAIIGVACYARLTGEESYAKQAKTMAEHLLEKIGDKGNTPLTLDGQGWSMKYNLLWDKVLGLGLMPESFYAAETASYLPRINTYGLPLDSRADYTKSDWICWTARMADDAAVRTALIAPIAKELRETTSRVPFSDWYDTKTGRYVAFIARSVQGGIFALML